jgi:hypothetical protein
MFVECRHIMPRGAKCKAAALRDRPYCYFHDKLHDYTRDGLREDKGPVCLASIEDACGIQHALMQIMGAMINGRLDSRDGVRLIYGLQVAIQALDRVPQTPPQEMVQATACDGIGVDLAEPGATLCEPHTECPTCNSRYGCENVARQSKKSIRDYLDEAHDRPEGPGACQDHEPLALPAIATDSGALLVLSPGAAASPDLLAPAIEPQKEAALTVNRDGNLEANLEANREADLQARIDKFRINKLEADREARDVVLSRMLADHEITLDDILALPHGSMEIPKPRREWEEPLRDLCSVGNS